MIVVVVQVKPQLEEEPLFETAEPEEAESLDMPRVAFCLVAVGMMIILAAADVVKIDVAVLVVSVLLIATGENPSNTFTVGVGWGLAWVEDNSCVGGPNASNVRGWVVLSRRITGCDVVRC